MTNANQKKWITPEPWSLSIEEFNPKKQMLLETLFAQANGYIGSRGSYEEPLSDSIVSCEGVYLNGVYQQEPIVHAESAYGFATHNQKMIQVPNGKQIFLTIDGEHLTACSNHTSGTRELDFKTGVLTRTQNWKTNKGKRLTIKSRRFVSLANEHLMGIEYQLISENFSGEVRLTSALDASYDFNVNKDDPRAGQLSLEESLILVEKKQDVGVNGFLHHVKGTDFVIASVAIDVLPSEVRCIESSCTHTNYLSHTYSVNLTQEQPVTFYKWVGYNHTRDRADNLFSTIQQFLDNAIQTGFESNLQRHTEILDTFWDRSDIIIEGDALLQQGIRFNLLHVYLSTSKNGNANIGAKGLTGHGYDGHYFWDTEIYVIPSLCFSHPEIARNLIEFRINTLDQARLRARQMSHASGALFPWRTIGGQECSAYFPAGTAQYHINAAVAYALKCYVNASGDNELLWQGGAEMLFETARLWIHLGHFNAKRSNAFCIDAVTGPDEYTAVVNNNFYTNAMAQMHLRFAVDVSKRLKHENTQQYQQLIKRIGLTDNEISVWHSASEHMYLPYDEHLGIHMQDDSFLNKAPWDFANTPADRYPLLLHYHPLVIYRYQVLKQADVVLAMFLLDDEFTVEQKKRNLDYYEPITTHDSTLSSCIHSIQAAETGEYDKAYSYFENTSRMDLDNCHDNSEYGVHIACMAGSWASIVHGFAGFRARQQGLFFNPYLPNQWQSYCFKLVYRENQLQVHVSQHGVTYTLISGPGLTFNQNMQSITLNPLYPEQTVICADRVDQCNVHLKEIA